MSIMAKTPNGHKKIKDVYSGETIIDKILDKDGAVLYAKERELTGVPPLEYKGKEETTLSDYRIYGNTETKQRDYSGSSPLAVPVYDGELYNYRVYGQTSRNLFDENSDSVSGYIDDAGNISQGYNPITTYDYIAVTPTENYYIKIYGETSALLANRKIRIAYYSQDKTYLSRVVKERADEGATFETLNNCYYIRLSVDDGNTNIMLNAGSEPLPYEPYGESVGDRTKNLWNGVVEQGAVSTTGDYSDDSQCIRSRNIELTPGTYSISCNLYIRCIYAFNGQTKVGCVKDLGGGAIQSTNFTVPDNADNVSVGLRAFDSNNQPIDVSPSDFEWGQIEQGSNVTTYEPYGYRVPVTVTNGADTQTTNLYLPEQIKMVGDEAEYIDFGQQKQHRVRKNLCQINKTNNAVISHAIEGQIYTFSLTADFSVGFRILKRNADSGSTETVVSVFNREGRVSATFTANENFDVYVNGFSAVDGKTFLDSVHDFMFEKGATASEYEPYIEDTELDVTLPALPISTGTNTVTVNTAVQPSNVEVSVDESVSVGDLVTTGQHAGEYVVPVTVEGKNLFDFREWSINVASSAGNDIIKNIDSITLIANIDDAFTTPYAYGHIGLYKINVKPNTTYVLSWASNNNLSGRVFVFKNGAADESHRIRVNNAEKKYLLFDTDTNTEFVTLRFGVNNAGNSITYSKIMLIEGSSLTPYEPYHAPVTTNVYLQQPIKMVDGEPETVDLSDTNQDVSIFKGTNILSVGTEVQPNRMDIKGRIKELS